MKKHKILYLPLDERPCNYQFAQDIAQGTSIELIVPSKSVLGNKKNPANFEELKNFLIQNATRAESCILSIDMLLYGGIVPSRLHNFSLEQLKSRLNVLHQLKDLNKNLKIYAFALVMRCPSYSSDDEEPDYYETCGREIFLTGQVKHKLQLGLISQQEAERLLEEYSQKTAPYLQDYENRRKINREILVQAVNLLGNEIDYLVLPQDDSAQYGYTTMDREYVKKAATRDMTSVMYPGADEVGMVLMCRALCEIQKAQPRIKCVYANPKACEVIPLYEDRPLGKTLQSQIQVAGCIRNDDQCDIVLYLNYPVDNVVEAGFTSPSYLERDLPNFCEQICNSLAEGKVVSLADGAYCNGGDAELMKILASKTSLFNLSAYAGWNTSSNTLGTAICQAVFALFFGKTAENNSFLAKRFFEDIGYCGNIRKYVTDNLLADLGYNYFFVEEQNGKVAKLVAANLQKYMSENFPSVTQKYALATCQMPWKRMFEVDLSVTEK